MSTDPTFAEPVRVTTTSSRALWSEPVPQMCTPMDWVMSRLERADDGRDDPKAADAVVAAIEELPTPDRIELARRVLEYRPGNGDELAGRIGRLPLATRRQIQSAFAGVRQAALGKSTPSQAPAQMTNGAVTPEGYIAHWAPRLIHELAIAATEEGWAPPSTNVRWIAERAALATALEATLFEFASVSGGLSAVLPTLTYPVDAKALIAEYMDPHETVGTDPAWQPHVVARLGLPMRDAMWRGLTRMARRLEARAIANNGAPIASSELIPTEPVDRIAAHLLCTPGVAEVMQAKGGRVDTSPDDFAHGLRPIASVEFLGERDPNLWNWIDVKVPRDATREEVARFLLGTATDFHTDQAFAISRAGTRFAVPISLARGVPSLIKYAPDNVRTRPIGKTIEAQSRDDLVAMAGSPLAVEATARPSHSRHDAASTGDLTRKQLATHADLLKQLGVAQLAAPATQWLDTVLAKHGPELEPWTAALERQHEAITEAGSLLRRAGDTLLSAPSAPQVAELSKKIATAIGAAHLPGIGLSLLQGAQADFDRLPIDLLRTSARDLRQARLALSGVTRPIALATTEQAEQQDIDDRLIELERQQRSGTLSPSAIDEQALMQREYALRFRSQSLRDQTQALSKALDGANDGVIGWLSNIGHNGDIASAYGRFASISARAQDIVAAMENTIAQGPHALVSTADDGASTRALREQAVNSAEEQFAKLAGVDHFGEDLQAAWKLADESARRSAIGHIVAHIALLIGVSLVSMGVGAAVGGFVEGTLVGSQVLRTAMTATALARTARVVGFATGMVAEATGNAVGQTVVAGDSMSTAFAENLLSSAVILAALRPVQKLSQKVRAGIHAAEAGAEEARKLSAARRLWKYTKSGEMVLDGSVASLELLTQAGIGAVATRMIRGKPKNEAEATDWFVNGASMVIGRVIAGRMRGLEQRLREYGKISGYLHRKVSQRAKFAEAHSKAVDADEAWKLVEDYRGFLMEEAALLADPDAAELQLSPERIAELQQTNAEGLSLADERAISTVALLRNRLRAVSDDGVEWVGTAKAVDAAIAASHATVRMRDKGTVQVDIAGERRTLFIIEASDGPHMHERLRAMGAKVTPVNTDPARKQWHVQAGVHEADIHEAPRRTRIADSPAAKDATDLQAAAKRAEGERSYFANYQAHAQAKMEARGVVRVREAQVGLGSAGLQHAAQQPPAHQQDSESLRLIVAADLHGALELRGDQQLGQYASAVHTPEIPVAAHAPSDRRFTSQEYADASAHGRANLQANVLQGHAGVVEHHSPTANDWQEPSAALRFAVVTPSGKRVWVYADRVELLTGSGAAKLGELAAVTQPDVLAAGRADGSIVAAQDQKIASKLVETGRVLVIAASPTGAFGAELAGKRGLDVDFIGDVPPAERAAWDAKIRDAAASGDPKRIAEVTAQFRKTAMSGLALARNQGPGTAADPAIAHSDVGRPTQIVRRADGRYEVSMDAIVKDGKRVEVYDQIVYSYGQTKHDELVGQFGTPEAGGVQFELEMHGDTYVGLKMVGAEVYVPGPAVSPDFEPWILPSQRAVWRQARQTANAGTPRRDHAPITTDSHKVHDGFEAQVDRIGLANERKTTRTYRLPGTDLEMLLDTDIARWPVQIETFLRTQLPATPADKIRVIPLKQGHSGDLVMKVTVAGHDLGVIKAFKSERSASLERDVLSVLERIKLTRMTVVRERGELGIDKATSGAERALMMDAAPGTDLRTLALEVGTHPEKRAENFAKLLAAASRVAEGLADLHATFQNRTISPEAARAGRKSDADYFLDKLEDGKYDKGLGGHGEALRIAAALRDKLYQPFLDANVPSSAYHGDANIGNFKVNEWDGKQYKDLATFDIGTFAYGFENPKQLYGATPMGDKAAASADIGRFLGSFESESMVPKGVLSQDDLAKLRTAFVESYKSVSKERGVTFDPDTARAAENWYRVQMEAAAAQNDPSAVARIHHLLGLGKEGGAP